MEGEINNDTRGWIMCVTSGIGEYFSVTCLATFKLIPPSACVLGASIICVDIIVRLLPSKRDFRIQDSNVFLAASLSLSFGVMVRVDV